MPTEFKLPELGENITAGDVVRVLVSPGDTVAQDQPLLELETDKATIEVPSTVSGTVKDIKVKQGDRVNVGQVVLTVDDGGAARPAASEQKQKAASEQKQKKDEGEAASYKPKRQPAGAPEEGGLSQAAPEGGTSQIESGGAVRAAAEPDRGTTASATGEQSDRRSTADEPREGGREAKQQKPAWMGLADRVAAAFTPLVIVLAAGALVFWGMRLGFVQGLLIALSVLLIACPCTLGVATPLAFWTGLAIAARRGILVRSGVVLERLAQVTDVFFDKTGTLTRGTFRLAEVLSGFEAPSNGNGAGHRSLLQVAASLESRAEHPVAVALRNGAAAAGVAELPVSAWRAEPGLGVRGRVAGREVEYVEKRQLG